MDNTLTSSVDVTKFNTVQGLADAYGCGYNTMRRIIKKVFPTRSKGIVRPHEVKKIVTLLESGEVFEPEKKNGKKK